MSSLLHVPTTSQLKILYADILLGRTKMLTTDKKSAVWIKHLNVHDDVNSDITYERALADAKKQGLPTKKEQTKYLIEENLWSDEKERELAGLKVALGNLTVTKSKVFLEIDVENVKKQIEETEKKVFTMSTEKADLLGLTAELHADKKGNEYYMQNVLYKDEEFKEPCWNEEEFNDLTNEQIGQVFQSYQHTMNQISSMNIKRLSLKTFFCNHYYLCEDNPMTFYGKPVVDLTFNQSELFAYARYFKSLAQDTKISVPQEISDDPDALIEFYEGAKNASDAKERMDQGKGSQGSGASTIVGATKKDLEKLGYGGDEGQSTGIDLIQEAEKRGGQLDMQDFIDIHAQ